jgi:hypothetical protein
MHFTIPKASAAASKINMLKMKLNSQNVKLNSCSSLVGVEFHLGFANISDGAGLEPAAVMWQAEQPDTILVGEVLAAGLHRTGERLMLAAS